MNRREFFKRVDGISRRFSEMEKEIKRLLHLIEEKRRRGQDFDSEAKRLAILRSDLLSTQSYRPGFLSRLDIQCGGRQ